MAQNVTIAGASYPAVPGIEVPITNGGGSKAYFADTSPTTATDADVAQGQTAIVTPLTYDDAINAEAVFLEKCAYARRSGLPCHGVVLMDQTGKQIARKSYSSES